MSDTIELFQKKVNQRKYHPPITVQERKRRINAIRFSLSHTKEMTVNQIAKEHKLNQLSVRRLMETMRKEGKLEVRKIPRHYSFTKFIFMWSLIE